MFLLSALIAATITLGGCTYHKFESGEMMSVSDVNFATTRFRHGRACGNILFPMRVPFVDGYAGIPLGGEARVLSAIKNGGINKVEFAEHTEEWYVVFAKECIDVYGE